MKPAAQIQATIELLDEIAANGYPADRTMAQYFKQRRYIGSKDKGAISEHFYTVLRNKLSYEFLLERADLGTHSRMLAACMLCLKESDLGAYFTGEQYAPAPLRENQIAEFGSMDKSLEDAPLNVRLNVPNWITPLLESSLGSNFESEMLATNQRASTDVRVNLLKASRAQLSQVLQNHQYDFTETPLSPWGFRFETRVALFGLDAFRQGWFEVQDEGSQLLALLTEVEAGQKVVDFCAGAGGKTLALASMMQNKGTIYACDVHSKRLEQMSKRSKRAGVHNVRSHVLSSENDKWVKKHREMADVVLIDAPCSGTGTWRRNPDARWNLQQENLDNLQTLQASILQSAQRLVKPGGLLVYATCSLLREENEQQVEKFLASNSEFEPDEIKLPVAWTPETQAKLALDQYQLRTSPARSGTDGFYAARMRKKIAESESDNDA